MEVLLGNYYGFNNQMGILLEGIAGRIPEGMGMEYHSGALLKHPRIAANPLEDTHMTRFQKAFAVTWGGITVLSALTFVALLIVLCLGTIGCDTNKDTVMGTSTHLPRLQVDATAPDGSLNLRKYQTLYTSCGTFYLSYPCDFTGPIPAGYGRIGQTDPSYYCSNATYTVGDPTADE